MYRVRGKGLANVWRMYRVRRKDWRMSGECIESGESSWRMSGECIESDPFSKKEHFGEYSHSPNWRIFREYSNSTNSPASGHCLVFNCFRKVFIFLYSLCLREAARRKFSRMISILSENQIRSQRVIPFGCCHHRSNEK